MTLPTIEDLKRMSDILDALLWAEDYVELIEVRGEKDIDICWRHGDLYPTTKGISIIDAILTARAADADMREDRG